MSDDTNDTNPKIQQPAGGHRPRRSQNSAAPKLEPVADPVEVDGSGDSGDAPDPLQSPTVAQRRARYVRIVLSAFWALFWIGNVIDKIYPSATAGFRGTARIDQIGDFLRAVGINSATIAVVVVALIGAFEAVLAVGAIFALVAAIRRQPTRAAAAAFWLTLGTVVLFGVFSVGDIIFGDRTELWEHVAFLTYALVTFAVFRYAERLCDFSELGGNGHDRDRGAQQ